MKAIDYFFTRKLSTILGILFFIGIACFTSMLVIVIFWMGVPVDHDYGKLGQIGDFFGGILNPVFGFFGFLGILATLSIQNREISLTLDELKLSREIASDSERSSRLHAQLSAMSQILEIKRKQADEAMKTHSEIAKDKSKNNRQTYSPFDGHHINLYFLLKAEVEHYSDRIEKVLEELGGGAAPTSNQRRELQTKLVDELDKIKKSHA